MHIQIGSPSEIQRKIVFNALRKMGYDNIRTCSQGREILNNLAEQCPDLIVIDNHLDDQSGIDLTRRIRSLQTDQYTPVIMVGNEFTREQVIGAINAGVNQLLLKPILPERLQMKVNAVKNLRRASKPET